MTFWEFQACMRGWNKAQGGGHHYNGDPLPIASCGVSAGAISDGPVSVVRIDDLTCCNARISDLNVATISYRR